jgi:hypothetical protein
MGEPLSSCEKSQRRRWQPSRLTGASHRPLRQLCTRRGSLCFEKAPHAFRCGRGFFPGAADRVPLVGERSPIRRRNVTTRARPHWRRGCSFGDVAVFQHILCPVDTSASAVRASRYAGSVADDNGAAHFDCTACFRAIEPQLRQWYAARHRAGPRGAARKAREGER